MFYIEGLDLNIIKHRIRNQLLEGTFPSFSGITPDYDDFIAQVINKEAEIILSLPEITKLEDIYDYKTRASEFLVDILTILDEPLTEALEIIRIFVEDQEEPDEEITKAGRIRKARSYWIALQSPWFKITKESDKYQKLLERLKIIGRL